MQGHNYSLTKRTNSLVVAETNLSRVNYGAKAGMQQIREHTGQWVLVSGRHGIALRQEQIVWSTGLQPTSKPERKIIG